MLEGRTNLSECVFQAQTIRIPNPRSASIRKKAAHHLVICTDMNIGQTVELAG